MSITNNPLYTKSKNLHAINLEKALDYLDSSSKCNFLEDVRLDNFNKEEIIYIALNKTQETDSTRQYEVLLKGITLNSTNNTYEIKPIDKLKSDNQPLYVLSKKNE